MLELNCFLTYVINNYLVYFIDFVPEVSKITFVKPKGCLNTWNVKLLNNVFLIHLFVIVLYIYIHCIYISIINHTSCVQVHELAQSYCHSGDNRAETLSSWLHIYHAYLVSVKFEHVLCCGSLSLLTTYIYWWSFCKESKIFLLNKCVFKTTFFI